MRFAGIIAEYDPFHNGHAWQLQQARAMGAQRIAVAMSCGLTQRGALPLLPEQVRAHAALLCGADIIYALPAPYACAGAEAFARAGVCLLSAAGCDALVFGAETPDADLLQMTAKLLVSEAYKKELKHQLSTGARSFAAARQQALAVLCPGSGAAELLDMPNNNLAVEYCKAILEQGVKMTPMPLPRHGANHGEKLDAENPYASASALRTLWQQGGADAVAPYVPQQALELYRDAEKEGSFTDFATAERSELALLRARCKGAHPFAQVRGTSEGVDNRLERAVRNASTYEELLTLLTTVRYPRARMRRFAMDAALGWNAGELPVLPPYLHVLAARKAALPLIKQAALPAGHSLARLEKEGEVCARAVAAQVTADDFAAFCRKTPAPMGASYRTKNTFLSLQQHVPGTQT